MFTLTLVTPEKKVFVDLSVTELLVKGFCGEMNILPGHAPLITTLKPGVLSFKTEKNDHFRKVALGGGYCEVTPQGVNVLADTAELAEQIDKSKAKKDLQEAQKRLCEAGLAPEEYTRLQDKIEKAKTRLHLKGEV